MPDMAKSSLVFLPADGEVYCLLLPSLVSCTVRQHNGTGTKTKIFMVRDY